MTAKVILPCSNVMCMGWYILLFSLLFYESRKLYVVLNYIFAFNSFFFFKLTCGLIPDFSMGFGIILYTYCYSIFYFILFYFILFYFILFYFILFYFILFYFILF